MASYLEMEMNSCLTEMERLQSKMMELQQTKKQQDAEEEEKTKEIEPNMAVMKEWLDICNFNQEQKKMSEVAKKNHDDYLVRLQRRNTCQNTRYNPLSEEEEEERKTIMDNYKKYCSKKSDNYHSWIVPNNLKSIKLFSMPNTNEPSEFMIDYIEATYNLFQIQQKRIDELEILVAKLNAKIE
jgi:hypothetical protein